LRALGSRAQRPSKAEEMFLITEKLSRECRNTLSLLELACSEVQRRLQRVEIPETLGSGVAVALQEAERHRMDGPSRIERRLCHQSEVGAEHADIFVDDIARAEVFEVQDCNVLVHDENVHGDEVSMCG